MSKEEASAWRRKQRRLRNRESAAASRQKTRDRINELEKELDEWKSRFAMLEAQIVNSGQIPCTVAPTEEDLALIRESSTPEPTICEITQQVGLVSPPHSPVYSSAVISVLPQVETNNQTVGCQERSLRVALKEQHIKETISRPA